jgi:hypothetical protein
VTMTKETPIKNDTIAGDEIITVKAPQKPRNRRLERLFEPSEVVDIRNIVANAEPAKSVPAVASESKTGIQDLKFVSSDLNSDADRDFVDNPEVPPLC